MKSFIDRLKSGEVLICDGAMGTSLQDAGLEPGQAPEEWNVSKPEAVRKIHRGFIDAGCDIIVTNTFGGNPIKLKRAGIEKEFERVNIKGVEIAKDAAAGKAYVFGDIGPTGEFLKPAGTHEYKEFYEAFLKQAGILRKAGVDAFIIETMSDLKELEAAVSACKDTGGLPVVATMTFSPTKLDYRTMNGVSVSAAVDKMKALGCDVFGANCGCGSKQMAEVMAGMRKAAGKDAFLIAQANAGMPKLVDGKTVFMETPAEFASGVKELIKHGINIIGGCCGTTPEHIKEIAKAVKAH